MVLLVRSCVPNKPNPVGTRNAPPRDVFLLRSWRTTRSAQMRTTRSFHLYEIQINEPELRRRISINKYVNLVWTSPINMEDETNTAFEIVEVINLLQSKFKCVLLPL